jgi:hypothetical protein
VQCSNSKCTKGGPPRAVAICASAVAICSGRSYFCLAVAICSICSLKNVKKLKDLHMRLDQAMHNVDGYALVGTYSMSCRFSVLIAS